MHGWVNFRQIKSAVPIGAVLQHYAWKCLKRRGDRVEGRCPIHCGQGENAFHADLRNNGFHCFSCHAAGGVLDLVAKVERCSLRQAALRLQEWFDIERTAFRPATRAPDKQLSKEKVKEPVPLRFSLRPIDSGHWYLKQRGIHVDTAAHFGVGYYAGPGLMRGRVVIPIHNECRQLVAYAGRSIDGADPKYKLPAGFAKSKVLFNLHRALTQGQDTVIVGRGVLRLYEGPSSRPTVRGGAHGLLSFGGTGEALDRELPQDRIDAGRGLGRPASDTHDCGP